ncbi:class I SAM-dependent DNA methyltransferase [Haematomicrobium sanguinis]|uniref:class I SAM-dependent DNA methyltransferase n=1 Tax=Haematomicrobium sanguinis TaxID=479106 RepID=UPI00068F1FEB|nr:class I SAM-dependent methyltransferase [Haematomicrobium sanguinis]
MDANHSFLAFSGDQEELWNAASAQSYDTPGEGMFAPEVLGPTVEVLERLADGGAALEFAIGTGRVALPLRERGVPVSGIEISRPMIAQLRTKASEDLIPVVRGDMSTARVEGEFTLVYLVFNTIGNLLTEDAQIECFRNAARHLRPGGRFVIELGVPKIPHRDDPQALVFSHSPGYFGIDTYDTVNNLIVSHHFRFDPELSNDADHRQATVSRTPHRYILPAELDLMARIAGFELDERYSDWSGSDFTSRSTSQVSIYRLTQ